MALLDATTLEDLNPCVRQILCGLSSATIQALSIFLDAQILLIQSEIAVIEAQILQYDVLAAGVGVLKTLALSAIETFSAALNFVPFRLIANCVDLGDFSLSVRADVDRAIADTTRVLDDAQRLLSIANELRALKAELLKVVALYQALKATLALC